MEQGRRLLQHKKDVIAAVGQKDYEAALRALEKGLALAPADPLLLELHDTIKTVLPAGDASTPTSASCADSSDEAELEYQGSDSDAESLEATSSSTADSDTELQDCELEEAAGMTTCLPSDALCNGRVCLSADKSEAEGDMIQDQGYRKEEPMSSASEHMFSLPAPLGGIMLAPSCCTLTHQRRTEMRQQLLSSQEQQKAAIVEKQLIERDPLLT